MSRVLIFSIEQMFEDAKVKLLSLALDVPTAETVIFAWAAVSRRVAARPDSANWRGVAEFGFGANEIVKLRQTKMV